VPTERDWDPWERETLFEQACQYLHITEKWAFPEELGLCDRCGRPDVQRVQMGEEFPLPLALCFVCTLEVQKEAATKYSGYLGLAGVYAFGYLSGYAQRPVKAPKGAP
jgi:hypothetical protein